METRSANDVPITSIRSSWLIPTACAGCIAVVCATSWGHWQTTTSTASIIPPEQLHPPPEHPPSRPSIRFLQSLPVDFTASDNEPPNNVNDDITRDETCKEYIFKFLNGTTDFKDECQGMYNAYQAAKCSEDIHNDIILMESSKKKHKHWILDDDNTTQDDVLIDDFYENWECCSSIYQYYNSHCHEPELDSQRLLGIVSVLILCSMARSLLQAMGVPWVPDAAVCVIVGAITGGILRLAAPDVVKERLTFNNDLFLRILLPPIVFQAALKIDKRSFRRDVFPIFSFAIFGTVLSAVAVGFITHYMSMIGGGKPLPLLDSLLFGSLISSIDPVATLGILSSVGVSRTDTLFTLVFGESLLNDGVAIVLFDTLVKHLGDVNVVESATALVVLSHFFLIVAKSLLVGLVCGLSCTLYFYFLWGKHAAVTEVALFFAWALIPFYISDAIGGSGIIAIMVMGFCLDYYVIGGFQSEEGDWMDFIQLRCNRTSAGRLGDLGNVSDDSAEQSSFCDQVKDSLESAFSRRGHLLTKSRHHVGFVAEVIANIMETSIFAYLGLFLFNDNNQWDFRLNGIAIFGCVLSRAGMVVVISLLVNACVYFDVECLITRLWRKIFGYFRGISENNTRSQHQRTSGRNPLHSPLLNGGCDDDVPPTGEEDDDGDDIITDRNKRFLDMKTQLILLLAGVRGAVSFSLAANLPVYNAVTKRGSQFKFELKAMTSSSILFTLFVFGALTYFTVTRFDGNPEGEELVRPFTHQRRISTLASDNEGDDDSDGLESQSPPESEYVTSLLETIHNPLSVEMERSPPRPPPRTVHPGRRFIPT